jgi:hypothetical protein
LRPPGSETRVRPNTIDGYRNDLAHVTAALPKVRLDRLSPENIEHLWSYLIATGRTIGAPPAGFEPATRRLEGGRSNPLSYGGSIRR